jgi:ATP-dependent Clp protease ATP-binding subunit ClpC
MYGRFSPQAQQVIALAQEEARGLSHHYLGTEHLLLGLAREEATGVGGVLESVGLTPRRVRSDVVALVGEGDEGSGPQLPLTDHAQRVLERTVWEALSLGRDQVLPAHILLSLTRETDGVAARILRDCDADPEQIRQHMTRDPLGS